MDFICIIYLLYISKQQIVFVCEFVYNKRIARHKFVQRRRNLLIFVRKTELKILELLSDVCVDCMRYISVNSRIIQL